MAEANGELAVLDRDFVDFVQVAVIGAFESSFGGGSTRTFQAQPPGAGRVAGDGNVPPAVEGAATRKCGSNGENEKSKSSHNLYSLRRNGNRGQLAGATRNRVSRIRRVVAGSGHARGRAEQRSRSLLPERCSALNGPTGR